MLIKGTVNTKRLADTLWRLRYQERLPGAELIVRYPTWKGALAVNPITV
jgi:hypothetical protein